MEIATTFQSGTANHRLANNPWSSKGSNDLEMHKSCSLKMDAAAGLTITFHLTLIECFSLWWFWINYELTLFLTFLSSQKSSSTLFVRPSSLCQTRLCPTLPNMWIDFCLWATWQGCWRMAGINYRWFWDFSNVKLCNWEGWSFWDSLWMHPRWIPFDWATEKTCAWWVAVEESFTLTWAASSLCVFLWQWSVFQHSAYLCCGKDAEW
jgi:hypothetical protein